MSDFHRTLAKQMSLRTARAENQESRRPAVLAKDLHQRSETNEVFRQWFEAWSMRCHQQEAQSE